MPNYQDVTVGTTAQAISRVHEDGAVIAQLTIERSSVAVVAAAAVREGAADQPTIEPPPAVQTLATQTTIRLKPGQPLVISGGQPSSKESGQTWIVVTANVTEGGTPKAEAKEEPKEAPAAK